MSNDKKKEQEDELKRDSLIVQAVDTKPHRAYIRYLLVQRFSPAKIKKDLTALGLSAPHEPVLEKYYFLSIEPVIKYHKLSYLYAPYREAILAKDEKKKSSRFAMALNYRKDIMTDPETEIRFLRMVKELGIIDAFIPDLSKYYGKLDNVPCDPVTGKSFLDESQRYQNMPWEIVESPFRHVIEDMMMEGIPSEDIIDYMDKQHNTRVRKSAIVMYGKIFFSMERYDRTKKLQVLTAERENLFGAIRYIDNIISEMDRGVYLGEKGMPELLQDKKTLYSRISGLDSSIKTIQAATSEIHANQEKSFADGYVGIFEKMMRVTYEKFEMLSQHNDRGVVDPLYKLTRMMQNNYDMYQKAKENDIKGNTAVQAKLIEMVTQRETEIMDEEIRAREGLQGFDQGNYISDREMDILDIEGVSELFKKETDDDEE